MLKLPYETQEALQLDERIMATIYYGALRSSNDLAKIHGPYSTYEGSPASKGILQYDFWNRTPVEGLNWKELKESILAHGLRNSLLLAPMPTASTSQILGTV